MSLRLRRGLRWLAWALLLPALPALAFDLDQLGRQLAGPALLQGEFVQQKHLRALAQPLVSRGQFELSAEQGLLWQLRQPLTQDYRIDAQGIARLGPQGWQRQDGQDAAAQQSRLFLAVLQGDASGLARDFELQLAGSAEGWTLELLPRTLLLQQVFSRIRIQGGRHVERIELFETQGDRTLLQLTTHAPAASGSVHAPSD
jgi:hypothetical protein